MCFPSALLCHICLPTDHPRAFVAIVPPLNNYFTAITVATVGFMLIPRTPTAELFGEIFLACMLCVCVCVVFSSHAEPPVCVSVPTVWLGWCFGLRIVVSDPPWPMRVCVLVL